MKRDSDILTIHAFFLVCLPSISFSLSSLPFSSVLPIVCLLFPSHDGLIDWLVGTRLTGFISHCML